MPMSLSHGAHPRACRLRTHAETLLVILVAAVATSVSAATVSPRLMPPALVLLDNAGNSVTIDSTGAVTCTGSCVTTTPVTPSPGSITWAGTLGPFTIAAAAGQSKPALPPAQMNLILRASTGAFGAGAGTATLTARWSDVGFGSAWPQTHFHANFSVSGAVGLIFAAYSDNGNALFGTGTSVGTTGSSTSSSTVTITGPGPTSDPFSMTESVTATLGANSSFTLSAFSLTAVPPPLTLGCPSASGQVGVPYNSHVTAVGGLPPYTFVVSGNLPPGLGLNPSTGEITGTPTMPGLYSFTAEAQDTSGNPAQNTVQSHCNIAVGTPMLPLALACPKPNAQEGVLYSSALVASGGKPPYSFFITSGSLPPGLSLNPSTGAITGTDTTAAGSFLFTARVVDSSANSATNTAMQNCLIVAAAPPPPPPACKLWYTTDDAKSFTIHWSLPEGATKRVLEELVRNGTTWNLDKNQASQDVSPATGRLYGLSYELDGKKAVCPRLQIPLPACRLWTSKQGNRFKLEWSTEYAANPSLDPKINAPIILPHGEAMISPGEEITYTLTVKNRDKIYRDSSDSSKGTFSLESSCSTDVSPLKCTVSVVPDRVDATAAKPATVKVTWESKEAKTAVLQRLANGKLITPLQNDPPNPQNNPPKSQDLKVTQTTEFLLNVTGSANEKASCRACVLNRPDKGNVLDIPPLFQRNSMWCWLTVGEMVFKYRKVPEYDPWRDLLKSPAPTLADADKLYQWGILSVVHPACWLFPDACAATGGGSWQTLQDMLNKYPVRVGKPPIGSKQAPGVLMAAQIKKEIDAGRPIIAGIGFAPLTRVPLHVALIVGYVDKGDDVELIVNDPWPYQLLKQESPYIKAGGSQNCEANYTIPRQAFAASWNGSLINIQ